MSRLDDRPKFAGLPVPFMVDEDRDPIDFKLTDPQRVEFCAKHFRCGVCGRKIRGGDVAFIGPDDGRRCFGDPWMHPECAAASMRLCPFLAGRRGWHPGTESEHPQLKPFLGRYEKNMAAYYAKDGKSHRDERGAWHFEAIGELRPLAEIEP